MARVLIIEDDVEINQLIHIYLGKEGIESERAFDGQQAMICLDKGNYDLVILDLMLPIIDGFEVLRRLRERSKIPVLILTAKGEETDKIIGLGCGADDYVTKPFSVFELIARVKAHLRRNDYYKPSQDVENISCLQIGDLILDREQCLVTKKGVALSLTAKEYQLLELFLSHPRKVFTKENLYLNIWNDQIIEGDNTVMVHISRLRSKIEDVPEQPTIIVTVRGIGYKLGDL
ncbi:response regulator transcription factor [Paenibacillus anaericanus]|uniref:Response regulator transcription factor n=1 Tax=Paenibacillus anaericanus TaxID=170367 RepID=A0A433YEI6_9BACL|nr:response regulator transcription factor [Paenibacillus anaericanus]RUT48294.1 response regulator transcription factor [Paenibacillus anaericanus]